MTHNTRQSKAILPFHFGVHMQDPGQKPTLHVHAFSFILDCRFYTGTTFLLSQHASCYRVINFKPHSPFTLYCFQEL
jgi:hypothetical protein